MVTEKLPKIPLFGPSLIHQLWLLLSNILSTSFSIWGIENILVEINLESTRGDRGL
jgi:hypothetical protein